MGSVRTSIIGRPRRLPRDRRAALRYTVNCEEPLIGETEPDVQVGDSEDPLAFDTVNAQLDLKIQPVSKGQGSVLDMTT